MRALLKKIDSNSLGSYQLPIAPGLWLGVYILLPFPFCVRSGLRILVTCVSVITPMTLFMQLPYYNRRTLLSSFIHHLWLLRSFQTLFSNILWVFGGLAIIVYLFFPFLFWAAGLYLLSYSGNEPMEWSTNESMVSTQTWKNTLYHCFTASMECITTDTDCIKL